MCMCVVMCDVIQVANAMEGHWAGPPAMMNIFRNMFGAHLCPLIARRNNFGNFQRYLLQKHIPHTYTYNQYKQDHKVVSIIITRHTSMAHVCTFGSS